MMEMLNEATTHAMGRLAMMHACCFQMDCQAVVEDAAAERLLCEVPVLTVHAAIQPGGDWLLSCC